MDEHKNVEIDESIVLSIQTLYRGNLVRKYMDVSFREFNKISNSLGTPGRNNTIDFFKLNLWLSKREISLTQEYSDVIENDRLTELEYPNESKISSIVDSTEINKNLNYEDLQSVNRNPDENKSEFSMLTLIQLKDQFSELLQEKQWMENAILARIEYLASN